MQYCSSPASYHIETAPFTAIALLTTAQFIEAHRTNYARFQQNHIEDAATVILQNQFFFLLHWTLLYHRLNGKSYDRVTRHLHPRHFTPSKKDIATYIAAPHFLWRFSKNNFTILTDFINSLPNVKDFSILLEPYTIDTSLQLDYIRIKRLPNYFPFPPHLKDFHSVEYTYSLDFHLHKLKGDTTYQEFVLIILTGFCPRYRCGLYKLLVKYPSLENRHYNLQKLYNLVKRNSSQTLICNKWHNSTDWTHTVLLDINIFPLNFYAFTYMTQGTIVHINKHPFQDQDKRYGWTVSFPLNDYIDIVPSLFWRPILPIYSLTKHDRHIILRCQKYLSKIIQHNATTEASITPNSNIATLDIRYPYTHPYLDEKTLPDIKAFYSWLSNNGFSTGFDTKSNNSTFRYMSGYNHLFEENDKIALPIKEKSLLQNLFII